MPILVFYIVTLINCFLLDVVEKITDSEIKNLIKNIMSLKQ